MKPKTTNKSTPSAAAANCSRFRLEIRWLIRKDMPAVLSIEQRAFEFPWLEEDFLCCLRQRNCIAMVATIGDRVVGQMTYELHKGHYVILNFAVDPEFHRQGIGRAMMQTMKGKLCVGHRCKLIMDIRETNLAAQRFLKSEGFQCVTVMRDHWEQNYGGHESAYRFEHDISGPKQKTLELVADFDWHKIADGPAIVRER